MSKTLSETREIVRETLRRDSEALSNDRIDDFIYWSESRISDLHTFEEMYKKYQASTVKNQQEYTFPDRMKDILSLILIDGASSRKLEHIWYRNFDRSYPYPEDDTSARPEEYVDYGTYFELYPIPDDVYTLEMRCSRYPVERTSDDQESQLNRKDRLIIAGANAFGFAHIKESEDSRYWSQVFDRLYKEALETDHSAVDWTPKVKGFKITGQRKGSLYDGDYNNPFNG